MPQPSYVHGAGATPLIGATIGEYFDQIAERYAERDALIVRHQQVRWSWRELKQRVDNFAAGLLALGLERGERIAIWSANNAMGRQPICHCESRADPRQYQPRLSGSRARIRVEQGRVQGIDHGGAVQDQRVSGDARRIGAGTGCRITRQIVLGTAAGFAARHHDRQQ